MTVDAEVKITPTPQAPAAPAQLEWGDGSDLFNGVVGLLRRGNQAIMPSFPSEAMQGLGTGAAVLDITSSIAGIQTGIANLQAAERIADGEGARRAKVQTAKNVTFLGGAIVFLGQQIAQWTNPILASSFFLGTLMSSLYGAGFLIGMGVSALGIYRSWKFSSRTLEEVDKRMVGMTNEQKLAYLEKRTSKEVAEKIVNHEILSLKEIRQANSNNIAMHAYSFLTYTLFFVGIVLLTVGTGGIAGYAFLLTAVILGLLPLFNKILSTVKPLVS